MITGIKQSLVTV